MLAPRVHLHEEVPGQSRRCLEGLRAAAEDLARDPRMRATRSVEEVIGWIRAQPYLPDDENDRRSPRAGCRPRQRTRFWPTDGLNCWEALVHWLAAVLVHGLPRGVEVHVYDVKAVRGPLELAPGLYLRTGRRHVFPRLRGTHGRLHYVDLSSLAQPDPGLSPKPIPELRPAGAELANSDVPRNRAFRGPNAVEDEYPTLYLGWYEGKSFKMEEFSGDPAGTYLRRQRAKDLVHGGTQPIYAGQSGSADWRPFDPFWPPEIRDARAPT